MSDTPTREVYGPFLVHERLGAGGMAEVHRATRRMADGSEIEVGLKRLHDHLSDSPLAVEEFAEEARIASLMKHENICRFYEAGRLGDSYFIAMEYIEGRDLRSLLKRSLATRTPPPLSVVLSLLDQLCDALEYAHERADEDSGAPLEFVHRDVSPANILVARDGRLKVIDLGIAKSRTSEVKTDAGVIKGKFGYMAPEVLAGARADRRADIFAMGVVAWELLTAEPLFSGKTDLETMEKIRIGAVEPPSSRRHMCPPQLDSIVMRALARHPDDRWSTAAAMRTAVRAMAAAMHEPIAPRVVAEWLGDSPPVPIPITRESSDAITQVRHRTPRTMPRRPPRFATGTEEFAKLDPEELEEEPPPVAAEARPARATTVIPGEERRYRALAMLGGGLLTTAIIASLLLAQSRSADAGAELTLAVRATRVAVSAPAAPARSEEMQPVPVPAPEVAEVAAPWPASLEVDAHELRKKAGRFPRSRASRAWYGARLCTDARGKVVSVDVTEGPQRLHRRIKRNLRRWRYRPYRRDGAPLPVCFSVRHQLLPR